MPKANNIWRQIFDVRPVKDTGELDIDALRRMRQVVNLKGMGGYKYYLRELEAYFKARKNTANAERARNTNAEQTRNDTEQTRKNAVAKYEISNYFVPEQNIHVKFSGRKPEEKISLQKISSDAKEISSEVKVGARTIELIPIDRPKEQKFIYSREELMKELERYVNPKQINAERTRNDAAIRGSEESSGFRREQTRNNAEQTLNYAERIRTINTEQTRPNFANQKLDGQARKNLEENYSSFFKQLAVENSASTISWQNRGFQNKAALFETAIPVTSKRLTQKRFPRKIFFIPILIIGGAIIFSIFGFSRISDILSKKGEFASLARRARENLAFAQQSILKNDFSSAQIGFTEAYNDFAKINDEIKNLSSGVINVFNYIPINNKISSFSHLLRGGENITLAGRFMTEAIQPVSNIKFQDLWGDREPPLTEILSSSQSKISESLRVLSSAIEEFKKVDANDLPVEIKPQIETLRDKLPVIKTGAEKLLDFYGLFLDILGDKNPRKYLLIFENNNEIRATGGFIGTYGLLEIDRGQIKSIFIDGVFNADGQLHEKIIPPQPIQKISTAWSMHDANWFADFPTSAEKISWFYEKTGGPTVDGVIAFTPYVIEKILGITGPIPMPEYGTEVNSDNFVEVTQYEVEVDYDKKLNQPKKFISDLFPKIIEKVKELPPTELPKIFEIFQQGFSQKHILIYFFDKDEQNFVLEKGWGGEIKTTDSDYLTVVSSNINGYKTDKMIDEKINHQAEITADGSITDIITITRKHLGGKEKYDWWNRVNSDYLRVYVPQGSELLEARGYTLEKYAPPIDYEKQGFKKDFLVEQIESTLKIDKTGTQIFEESGKTVFGNWVYVSPGKTVEVVYKYKLPFKVDASKSSSNYSLLAQKQSGSEGSKFNFSLKIPDGWQIVWKYPEKLEQDSSIRPLAAKLSDILDVDRFYGVTIVANH